MLAATGARAAKYVVCDGRTSTVMRARCRSDDRSPPAGGTVVKDTKTHAARRIASTPKPSRCSIRTDSVWSAVQRCRVDVDQDGFVFTATSTGRSRSTRTRSPVPSAASVDGQDFEACVSTILRHFRRLLAAGVPVRTVSGRLGHANAADAQRVRPLPRSERPGSGRRNRWPAPGDAPEAAQSLPTPDGASTVKL